MTRIALVVNNYPTELRPHSGMQFYQQAKALASLADLTVYLMAPQYPRIRLLQPRRFSHRDGDRPLETPNVRVKQVSYSTIPVIGRLLNGWQCGRQLMPRFRESKPDVVLSYQLYPEAYGAVQAANALGIPCIVGAIGSDIRCSGPLVRPLIREAMRRSSFVLTVCDEMTARAINIGVPLAKVRTIPNGSDPLVFHWRDRVEARRELGVSLDSRLIVFTGNFVHVKGIPDLIHSIALLRQSSEPVEAALIGTGPMESQLRALSVTLGVSERIRFVGSMPPSKVALWLGASDLFCLPSYSEGSPNAMVEALCSGRPVVASDVGGIPELLTEDAGILVPPARPQLLAAALGDALRRDWDERAISRRYRRTWDDMARETFDVCREVLGQSQSFESAGLAR